MSGQLVNVTIPVLNEETQLAASVTRLRAFLAENWAGPTDIVIADNGSTDGTLGVARDLASAHPDVRVVHLEERGRGRALKKVWQESRAQILSYMDVDLSTDLRAFPSMLRALSSGSFDLATGSRLLNDSLVRRSLSREVLSRGYNWLVCAAFHTHFSDAQCGFKAITAAAARELLPCTESTRWLFDTELLVLAESFGYRILDLPVRWVEDTDSRVRILPTIGEDLRGIFRLRYRLSHGLRQRLGRPSQPTAARPASKNECRYER